MTQTLEMNQLQKFTIELPKTNRNVEIFQKGEGDDLVFLHGAGGLGGWTPDLDLLARRFRVTAPAFPGFGNSTGVDSIYDVLDAVLHNFDVLDQLGIERPHLAGHSMGGMLAAEMAAICPERVRKLVLVCPVGLWDDAHPVLDFFTMFPQELVPYIFHDRNHPVAQSLSVTPSTDDALVNMYVEYVKGLSAAGRLLWPIPDRGLSRRIHRIKAPTLILWGKHDGLVSSFYAGEFGKRIENSKVKIIEEASHMLLLEQPEKCTSEIISFLS